MVELLRKKCEEILENDDFKLGSLKENKSLKTKVESLTRKVNNLQTKLAAAKATLPAPTTVEQRIPSSSSTITASSSSLSSASISPVPIPASTSRPRTTTIIGTSSSSVPSGKVSPLTISGTTNRVVSVPSALPRPKTPERRTVLGLVFRAMSPKKDKPKPEQNSAQSKSCWAPDDYEGYEIPPQAFTAESLWRCISSRISSRFTFHDSSQLCRQKLIVFTDTPGTIELLGKLGVAYRIALPDPHELCVDKHVWDLSTYGQPKLLTTARFDPSKATVTDAAYSAKGHTDIQPCLALMTSTRSVATFLLWPGTKNSISQLN
ncbi:hypothetical protein EV360DRAFT_88026 [Lentinula raphanica]|nr:hypothetical protein EV360DRAFT_88026 [Lentinula raphanica]